MDRLNAFLHHLATSVEHLAESWGAPGLAAVAFVDSSFLPLPEVADLLVVIYTTRAPDQWLYFAAMTTFGSVAGCYALYLVGRKGGEALVRRGFHERHVDRSLEWFRRHGAVVLIIPAVLPPPMPFKLFVLMAGVSGVRSLNFVVSVAIGKGVRYGAEAWLARWYGEDAFRFIQDRASGYFWPALVAVALALAGWWLWSRIRRPGTTSGGGADVE